ncbi:unnamed protein product [Linum trigynum]|uniref:Uncharacterized protein n=1 Tax=Linum trigynum TaxID=586398 RepID=A0AAV2FRA1_9ROSI
MVLPELPHAESSDGTSLSQPMVAPGSPTATPQHQSSARPRARPEVEALPGPTPLARPSSSVPSPGTQSPPGLDSTAQSPPSLGHDATNPAARSDSLPRGIFLEVPPQPLRRSDRILILLPIVLS